MLPGIIQLLPTVLSSMDSFHVELLLVKLLLFSLL